jgi:hypothetical protein
MSRDSTESKNAIAPVTRIEGKLEMVDRELTAQFAKLEHDWMDCLRRGDHAKTASFLAPEYVLIIAAHPTTPISRDQWVKSLPAYTMPEFRQAHFVARRINDTVVTSFVHYQKATVGPGHSREDRSGFFWVVDIWRQVDGEWKVASRYTYKVEGEKLPDV